MRQNTLLKNRITRYTIYALGEIVLVVLGILIALYVNNRNIENKDRLAEIEILKEIKSNLENNILVFEGTIETENDYLTSNLLILDYLDNKKPYNLNLNKAFGDYFWTVTTNPITSGYEHLKSKGLDLIKNNSLREEISNMHDNEFSILKQENEVWSNNLQQSVSYPYHVNLFRSVDYEDETSNGAKPFNYEALYDDNKFKSINGEIIVNRRWNIASLQEMINKMKHLIISISNETESLSN